jgi:hypothetical protein
MDAVPFDHLQLVSGERRQPGRVSANSLYLGLAQCSEILTHGDCSELAECGKKEEISLCKLSGLEISFRLFKDGSAIWSRPAIDGPGVWVSCQWDIDQTNSTQSMKGVKGKEKQAVGEIYDLFDSVGELLQVETDIIFFLASFRTLAWPRDSGSWCLGNELRFWYWESDYWRPDI